MREALFDAKNSTASAICVRVGPRFAGVAVSRSYFIRCFLNSRAAIRVVIKSGESDNKCVLSVLQAAARFITGRGKAYLDEDTHLRMMEARHQSALVDA